MYVIYTNNSILASLDSKEINQIIKEIKGSGLRITEEGELQDFLGIDIKQKKDGSIHIKQPHFINQILKDLRLSLENMKTNKVPCASSRIMKLHKDSAPFD